MPLDPPGVARFGPLDWNAKAVFGWLMVIAAGRSSWWLLVGYPFFYGIWLSLENRPVAKAGTFVGLDNFIADWHDPVFWQVAQSTPSSTPSSRPLLKMVGGLGLALVMNQDFRFKNMPSRAMLLLPFIVPTVLSTIAWMWILDPAFAPVNWFLMQISASPIPARPGSAIPISR